MKMKTKGEEADSVTREGGSCGLKSISSRLDWVCQGQLQYKECGCPNYLDYKKIFSESFRQPWQAMELGEKNISTEVSPCMFVCVFI